MGTRKSPSAPQWQVILEEMKSQNRSTMEAVEAFRQSIEERIDSLDRDSRDRDGLMALALTDLRQEVRQHTTDLTELKRLSLRHGGDIAELKDLGQQHSADIAELKDLGQQHSADIAELKELGQQHSADIAELRELGQQHRADIREVKVTVQENTVGLRSVSQKVDALNRIEERVAALERRAAEPEGSSTPPPA